MDFNEKDLEQTLNIDIYDLLKSLAIDEDYCKSILAQHKNLTKRYLEIEQISPLFKNRDVLYYKNYNYNSVYTSNKIELEDIKVSEYENNQKLKAIYTDDFFLRYFNLELIKNLKKVHKIMFANADHAGKTRDILKHHAVINVYGESLLPVDYNNFKKYFNVLVDLVNANKQPHLSYAYAWVIHCYFEAIHPFVDGNGRVGRFFLNNQINIYNDFNLYLDDILYKNKESYYENIYKIQVDKNYKESIDWFLKMVELEINRQDELLTTTINNYHKMYNVYKTSSKLRVAKHCHELAIITSVDFVSINDIKLIFGSLDLRTKKAIMNDVVELGFMKFKDGIYKSNIKYY